MTTAVLPGMSAAVASATGAATPRPGGRRSPTRRSPGCRPVRARRLLRTASRARWPPGELRERRPDRVAGRVHRDPRSRAAGRRRARGGAPGALRRPRRPRSAAGRRGRVRGDARWAAPRPAPADGLPRSPRLCVAVLLADLVAAAATAVRLVHRAVRPASGGRRAPRWSPRSRGRRDVAPAGSWPGADHRRGLRCATSRSCCRSPRWRSPRSPRPWPRSPAGGGQPHERGRRRPGRRRRPSARPRRRRRRRCGWVIGRRPGAPRCWPARRAAVLGLVGPLAVARGWHCSSSCALHPARPCYVYLATLPVPGRHRPRRPPPAGPAERGAPGPAARRGRLRRLPALRPRRRRPAAVRPLDVPLAVFVLLSTLWPLSWLLLRGRCPDGEELAALLPVCKLSRCSSWSAPPCAPTRSCSAVARIIIWPAAAIAVIAVLQTPSSRRSIALLDAVLERRRLGPRRSWPSGARRRSPPRSPPATTSCWRWPCWSRLACAG